MITQSRGRRVKLSFVLFFVTLIVISMAISSCGKSDTDKKTSKTAGTGEKLPPGTTEEDLENTSYTGTAAADNQEQAKDEAEENAEVEDSTQTPGASADVAGARFTVVEAARKDSNEDAIQSGQREVSGDYLEVELEVRNVGDGLVDLSHYSFRIESPGIDAGSYSDYYGQVYTYGKYVTDDTISGVLMDYSDLQAAQYVMKIGELVDKLFLFYDLNPESVARNDAVTKDNTTLIIKKIQGSDYGEKAEISLSGYPD